MILAPMFALFALALLGVMIIGAVISCHLKGVDWVFGYWVEPEKCKHPGRCSSFDGCALCNEECACRRNKYER